VENARPLTTAQKLAFLSLQLTFLSLQLTFLTHHARPKARRRQPQHEVPVVPAQIKQQPGQRRPCGGHPCEIDTPFILPWIATVTQGLIHSQYRRGYVTCGGADRHREPGVFPHPVSYLIQSQWVTKLCMLQEPAYIWVRKL
jgi:hypothetical protein